MVSGTPLQAAAFDLDGTLYPNYRFYRRIIPRLFMHFRFYRAFVRARQILHRREEAAPSFYDEQASIMAAMLGAGAAEIRDKAERLIYHGWEELFSGVQLFPHVKETLASFRRAGLRLGLLSDFPPDRKITLLGLEDCFDVVLSTEETGALKPSPVPFTALAKALDLAPESILYVGNSMRYDVEGARRAGMKTALIRRSVFSTGSPGTGFFGTNSPGAKTGSGGADFIFRDYRQLEKYVVS